MTNLKSIDGNKDWIAENIIRIAEEYKAGRWDGIMLVADEEGSSEYIHHFPNSDVMRGLGMVEALKYHILKTKLMEG